jgi:hypothetical protein
LTGDLNYTSTAVPLRLRVRRILSLSLLLLFSLPLISPLVAADAAEMSLPACCRRDGKHHCRMVQRDANGRIGFQAAAVHERCSNYPAAPIRPRIDFSSDEGRAVLFAEVVIHPSGVAQTEVRRCISFDRSRQKRGPPFRQA